MAVAFDAATEPATFTTTTPYTFSHTPTGTPAGILLEIDHGDVATDLIDGAVTYGGVAMVRVGHAVDTATKPGGVYNYFLGEGIPSGTQTVSISHTGSADVKHCTVASVTAAADTEIGSAGAINENASNPRLTMFKAGVGGMAFSTLYSGSNSIGDQTPVAGTTPVSDHDFGNFTSHFDRETTTSATDFVIGYGGAGTDTAFVAVTIQEQQAGLYVKGSVAPFLTTSTTSFIIPMAGQLADVDLYVLGVSRAHTSADAFPTCTDDGPGNTWDLIANSTDRKGLLWHKKGVAADAGATVTVAGCLDSTIGVLTVVAGAASGDPTTNISVEDNISGNETHAGFTPTNADSLILFGIADTQNDNFAVTSPAAAVLGALTILAERFSTGGNDVRATMTGANQVGGPAGTGDFTWSQGNSVTRSIVFAVAPPDSGISGAGSSTLADVTSAGSGTYTPSAITGTGASTFEDVTSAGTGVYTPAAIIGTGSSSLEPVTSLGTGTFTPPGITGTGSSTLDDVVSAGTGTATPPQFTGTGSSTLDDVSSAGVGVYGSVVGSGASALEPVVSVGTGTFTPAPTTGSGASTLDDVISDGTGFFGDIFLPEITCQTYALGAACETTALPVVCAILALNVECET